MTTPCSFDGCENAAKRAGYCWSHVWQEQHHGEKRTVTKRPASALERLTEAAIAYAEADEDEEFNRARDNLRKSAMSYGQRGVGELIRERLAEARARGVRLGRPPKLDVASVEILVVQWGGVRSAARALGVAASTVVEALRKARQDK